MVRHLLEDHPPAGTAGAPGHRHPHLCGHVEQLSRLVGLHAKSRDFQPAARPGLLPRAVPEPVGFDHGRFSDRDSADPDRLHRRPAVLRSRHRDYRHEIVEDLRAPRRPTFDEVAELYDRVRPGYPAELFDDLVELAGLNPGSRVLEIGCGTGQATLPMAERKFDITAIEVGPKLAAVASRNLARFSNVNFIVGAFEEWPVPRESFDAVVSATAFHWLDPSVRVTRAAGALRLSGVLATIATHHVDGGDAQ